MSYSGADSVLAKLRGKGLKESFVGKLRESIEGVNETLVDSMRKCLELVQKKYSCRKKERSSDPDEVSYALIFKPDAIKGTLIKSLEAYVDFTASQKQWYLKIKVSADKCVVTYEGNPHPFDWVMSESYLDSNIRKAIEQWEKRYDNMAKEYGWPSRDLRESNTSEISTKEEAEAFYKPYASLMKALLAVYGEDFSIEDRVFQPGMDYSKRVPEEDSRWFYACDINHVKGKRAGYATVYRTGEKVGYLLSVKGLDGRYNGSQFNGEDLALSAGLNKFKSDVEKAKKFVKDLKAKQGF